MRISSLRRAVTIGLCGLAVSLFAPSASALGSPAASASVSQMQATSVGADGTIRLDGRGAGHGVGMSQYGARGGANAGADARAILAAYYPGAALQAAPDSAVRVLLSRWDGKATCASQPEVATPCLEVVAEPGQVLTNRASGAQVPVPAAIDGRPVTSVAVGTSASGLRLWAYAGGWQPLAGGASVTGPVDVTAPDGAQAARIVGTGDHAYRGTIRVVRESATSIRRVNVLPLEDYLLGVVPQEMPAEWPAAAVQAQGVAARTYAAAAMRTNAARSYDLCDTTSCQVYGGQGAEHPTATAKLAAGDVRGQVLAVGGAPITAFFASSNGGASVSGGAAHLPARVDGWDPSSGWTRTVTGECLAAKYPGKGAFQRLVVLSRDGLGPFGGRVTSVRFDFSGGSTTVGPGATPMATDAAIRASMSGCGGTAGLSSSLWQAADSSVAPVGTGRLDAGQTVASAASLTSPSGQFSFTVDPAGAAGLALRSPTCAEVPFARTAGASSLAMQTDGNLVLYSGGRPAWHSGTFGNPGAYAVVQDDANIVVYSAAGRPLWWSGTSCSVAVGFERSADYTATRSPQPATLTAGMTMTGAAGTLAMQSDGNLVLYRGGRAVWSSGSAGNPGAKAVLQTDGNLVVYTAAGRAVYSSGTNWPADAATLTDETRLSLQGPTMTISRTVRDTRTGAQVSTITPWSTG